MRWTAPPAATLNGDLSGYEVRYARYEELRRLFPAYAVCAYQLVRAFLEQQPLHKRTVPYEGFFFVPHSRSAGAPAPATAPEVSCERLTAAELDRLLPTSNFSVPASTTTLRACNLNLRSWTIYFVWVAAANRVGTGVYSHPTLILTPESGARCSLYPSCALCLLMQWMYPYVYCTVL